MRYCIVGQWLKEGKVKIGSSARGIEQAEICKMRIIVGRSARMTRSIIRA
jgi:hypothetical protein